MLPPALTGRIKHFARLRQTGSITLHFHQGTLTRLEYAVSQRPDAACTCDLATGAAPCAACEQDHRAPERLRMAPEPPR